MTLTVTLGDCDVVSNRFGWSTLVRFVWSTLVRFRWSTLVGKELSSGAIRLL